jgi:hypothetical protein
MRCGKQAPQQRNHERDQRRGHGISPHGPSHAVAMLAKPGHHLRPVSAAPGSVPTARRPTPDRTA